jgi:hypothetical protein
MSAQPTHHGIHYRRVNSGSNPREKVFADAWEHENAKWFTLKELMFWHAPRQLNDPTPWLRRGKWCFRVRRRDTVIVATIIQWLGSNCGMDFLERALHQCGYQLKKIEP